MPATDKSHALDHVVVVLFENRSFDNVLGHLYGPGGREELRRGHRQEPEQSDSAVGRARRGAQGGSVRSGDRHGLAQPRLR